MLDLEILATVIFIISVLTLIIRIGDSVYIYIQNSDPPMKIQFGSNNIVDVFDIDHFDFYINKNSEILSFGTYYGNVIGRTLFIKNINKILRLNNFDNSIEIIEPNEFAIFIFENQNILRRID